MTPIRIIADDRETNPLLLETLRNTADAEVAVQRLELGDYLIDGRLLFERKTLADLVASLKDGRLLEQACRLAAAPLYKAMILEGTSHDLPNSGMRREAIQGARVQVTLFLGIPLLRSSGPEESARLMLYAARQYQSLARANPLRLFEGKRPQGKRKTQLQILQALPGIGPHSAQHLLEAFGNVEAVFCADEADLQTVSGVGETRARAIRWAVEEPPACYSCARSSVEQIVLTHESISLAPKDFLAVLDEPTEPNTALQRAFDRHAAQADVMP